MHSLRENQMTLENLIGYLIGTLLAYVFMYYMITTGKLSKLYDWLDALCSKFK